MSAERHETNEGRSLSTLMSDVGLTPSEIVEDNSCGKIYMLFDDGHDVTQFELNQVNDEDIVSLVNLVNERGSEKFRERLSYLIAKRNEVRNNCQK